MAKTHQDLVYLIILTKDIVNMLITKMKKSEKNCLQMTRNSV